MCGQAKLTRKNKDWLEGQQHIKETYEYPFDERCGDDKAGTAQCPNITPSKKVIFGSTPLPRLRVREGTTAARCPLTCQVTGGIKGG